MNIMRQIVNALERNGLILEADAELPSVATIIAGEPIRGSWWGHKAGKAIYNTCGSLEARDDVLRVKLIKGKVTYVHRNLWSDLLTIVTAKASWQTSGLSPAGSKLLVSVENTGLLRAGLVTAGLVSAGPAAKELEDRLLVLSSSIHTDSGAHQKSLESWAHWQERVKFTSNQTDINDAYVAIGAAAFKIGLRPAKRALPWPWHHLSDR